MMTMAKKTPKPISLRAKLRAKRQRDPLREDALTVTREQGVRLCIFLNKDFFFTGFDDLNYVLYRRGTGGQGHKRLGYFSRLDHVLRCFVEHDVLNGDDVSVRELSARLARLDEAIRALEGKEIEPVPTTD